MHFKSPADATDFHSAMLHIYCSAAREFVGVTRKGGRHFLCVNEPGAVLFGYASAAEMILHEQDILSNIKDEELHFDHPATESPGAAFIKEAVFTTKHGIDFFGEIKVNHFLYHGHEY
jgi:hypothetical protein